MTSITRIFKILSLVGLSLTLSHCTSNRKPKPVKENKKPVDATSSSSGGKSSDRSSVDTTGGASRTGGGVDTSASAANGSDSSSVGTAGAESADAGGTSVGGGNAAAGGASPNTITVKLSDGTTKTILKCVSAEEEQFFRTLQNGLDLLGEAIDALKKNTSSTLPGETAFKLYDTYGFPLDLTEVILSENNILVDRSGFEKCMAAQKSRSKQNWGGSGEEKTADHYHTLHRELKAKDQLPEFTGYQSLSEESLCVAQIPGTLSDGSRRIEAVFAKTPFYGESGGQLGDRGWVEGPGFRADVIDVQKPMPDLIVIHLDVKSGRLQIGQSYHQRVDARHRALTASNHTATHLLHWALHKVLGGHVKQAGSLVSSESLRFDFTHFQQTTPEELARIEELINEKIWAGDTVEKEEMEKDQAISQGAIAFFGEKYGDRVRVVKVGDYSVELCGGTHVNHAGELQVFKILQENSVAAGVRRITALTSLGAIDYFRRKEGQLKEIQNLLKVSSSEDLLPKLDRMLHTEKHLRDQLSQVQSARVAGELEELLQKVQEKDGITYLCETCQYSSDGIKRLRQMADSLRQKKPEVVLALGMSSEQEAKAYLLLAKGARAPAKFDANLAIKHLSPMIQGRGGGKKDQAQAGGDLPGGIQKALDSFEAMLPSWIS